MKYRLVVIFFILLTFLKSRIAYAAPENCGSLGLQISANPNPVVTDVSTAVHFTITDQNQYLNPQKEYYLSVDLKGTPLTERTGTTPINNGVGEIDWNVRLGPHGGPAASRYRFDLVRSDQNQVVCRFSYDLIATQEFEEGTNCDSASYSPIPADITTPISITYNQLKPNTRYRVVNTTLDEAVIINTDDSGSAVANFPEIYRSGITDFKLYEGNDITSTCILKINIWENADSAPGDGEIEPYDICQGVNNPECANCIDEDGVWTALGCIHFNPGEFITDFLKIAMGIAGGIALLLMVYGSFLISTSAGDPKKAEEGKEIITGTIAGLLFIIFSVVLLRLIGFDILKIPGF